jgi:hypothetical protein
VTDSPCFDWVSYVSRGVNKNIAASRMEEEEGGVVCVYMCFALAGATAAAAVAGTLRRVCGSSSSRDYEEEEGGCRVTSQSTHWLSDGRTIGDSWEKKGQLFFLRWLWLSPSSGPS